MRLRVDETKLDLEPLINIKKIKYNDNNNNNWAFHGGPVHIVSLMHVGLFGTIIHIQISKRDCGHPLKENLTSYKKPSK